MFEDFGQIKDELGASFALFTAIVIPVGKILYAAIIRRFEEMTRRIDKIEADRDRLSARLFDAINNLTKEIHSLRVDVRVLQAEVKKNGKRH